MRDQRELVSAEVKRTGKRFPAEGVFEHCLIVAVEQKDAVGVASHVYRIPGGRIGGGNIIAVRIARSPAVAEFSVEGVSADFAVRTIDIVAEPVE